MHKSTLLNNESQKCPRPHVGSSLNTVPFSVIINEKRTLRNILPEEQLSIYKPVRVIGHGDNGVVYECITVEKKKVAIKRILEDPTLKSREIQILKILDSKNVVKYLGHFYTPSPKPHIKYHHIVMEEFPMTLETFIQSNVTYPRIYIKLFAFQIFAGLAYIHSNGIIHRDISLSNILVDPRTGQLKICDFGCSKFYNPKETNTPYMYERPFRAPELIYETSGYFSAVDIWAAGCIYAFLLRGSNLFTGTSHVAQLYDMIRILGPPSPSAIQFYLQFGGQKIRIPQQQTSSLQREIPGAEKSEIEFLQKVFEFDPLKRIRAKEAIECHCFDELFRRNTMLPNNIPLPVLDREGFNPNKEIPVEEE